MSENSGTEYYVEKIVSAKVSQRRKGKIYWKYRVRWKDYGSDDDTEEPPENFNDQEIVNRFWRRVDLNGRDREDPEAFLKGDEFFPTLELPEEDAPNVDSPEAASPDGNSSGRDSPERGLPEPDSPARSSPRRFGPPKNKPKLPTSTSGALAAPSSTSSSRVNSTNIPKNYRKRKREGHTSRASSTEAEEVARSPAQKRSRQTGPTSSVGRVGPPSRWPRLVESSERASTSEDPPPHQPLSRLTHTKTATPPVSPPRHSPPPRPSRPKARVETPSIVEVRSDDSEPVIEASKKKKHPDTIDIAPVSPFPIEYLQVVPGSDDDEEENVKHLVASARKPKRGRSASRGRGSARTSDTQSTTPIPARRVRTRSMSRARGRSVEPPKQYASTATQTNGCTCDRCVEADAFVSTGLLSATPGMSPVLGSPLRNPVLPVPDHNLLPTPEEANFDLPAFDVPTFDEPAFDVPVFDEPAFDEPVDEPPVSAKIGPPQKKKGKASAKPREPSPDVPEVEQLAQVSSSQRSKKSRSSAKKTAAVKDTATVTDDASSQNTQKRRRSEPKGRLLGLGNVNKLVASRLPRRIDWKKLRDENNIPKDVNTPAKLFLEYAHHDWREGEAEWVTTEYEQEGIDTCWKYAASDGEDELADDSAMDEDETPASTAQSSRSQKSAEKSRGSKVAPAKAKPKKLKEKRAPSPIPISSDDEDLSRQSRLVGLANVEEVLRDLPHGRMDWTRLRLDYDIPSDVDTEERLFLDYTSTSWRTGAMSAITRKAEKEVLHFMKSYMNLEDSGNEEAQEPNLIREIIQDSEEQDEARALLTSPVRPLPPMSSPEPAAPLQDAGDEGDDDDDDGMPESPLAKAVAPLTVPRPRVPSHHIRAANPQIKLLPNHKPITSIPGTATKARIARGSTSTAQSTQPSASQGSTSTAPRGIIVSSSPNGTPHRRLLATNTAPKTVPAKRPSQPKFKPKSSLLTVINGELTTLKGTYSASHATTGPAVKSVSVSSANSETVEEPVTVAKPNIEPPVNAMDDHASEQVPDLLVDEPMETVTAEQSATSDVVTSLVVQTEMTPAVVSAADLVTPISPGTTSSHSVPRPSRLNFQPSFGSSRKPSTIFDAGGFLVDKVQSTTTPGSTNQPTFDLRLSNTVSIPVALKDLTSSTYATPKTLMDAVAQTSSSPSGKFYQALYADELLEALKMSGECARVAFNGTAGESSQQKWDRFVERLSNGDMFVVSAGSSTLIMCSSENKTIGERLSIEPNLLGLKDNVVMARVTIEDGVKFADVAMNAGT